MFKRQTTGSVVCVSCGYLVGVNDDVCYHCGRRNPGLWGFAPAVRRLGNDVGFVTFVTGTCIVMYGLSLLLSGQNVLVVGGLMDFLAPNQQSLFLLGASGAWPVFLGGRWWTVLSASWLHGGLLHILFNMIWIRQLAPAVAELYGPGRMIIIYTVAGAVGFALSSIAGYYLWFLPFLAGAQFTVGASAAIFGLLGALVYYGRRTGSNVVHSQALYYAVTLFVFGLIMRGVDNYAHAGGFVGGFIASRLLDPLKPERINHLVLALVCLAVSILSIIVSVIHGLAMR
ncbi:MAG TPA: rhomboid family intramembrane serine protease [Vicinamibacterales bacterium]|nr:rhomboid family intramembrane serine protease [Vicinamibacterales bacterium]